MTDQFNDDNNKTRMEIRCCEAEPPGTPSSTSPPPPGPPSLKSESEAVDAEARKRPEEQCRRPRLLRWRCSRSSGNNNSTITTNDDDVSSSSSAKRSPYSERPRSDRDDGANEDDDRDGVSVFGLVRVLKKNC